MNIAIKVGGSVFCPGDEPDHDLVHELAGALIDISSRHRILAVIGGGKLARKMIHEADQQGKSEEEQHSLGIKAARMNASALIEELGGKAFPKVPSNVEEVKEAFHQSRIVVVGGFRPGQTTDAVTVQSAIAIDAGIIIIGTDVKGVYDKDPKDNDDAEFIPEITPSELMRIVDSGSLEPGKNTIVDHIAAELIGKSGKKAIVLDIRDIDNLKKAIEGSGYEGTLIEKG